MVPYQSDPGAMQVVDNFCYQGGWLQNRSLFDTSFVNVVCETYNNQHWSMVYTEKIFKPIWFKRPFLLVGSRGALAGLKQLGFKTFDRWIDESYDLETDNYVRIEKITEELKKLCSLSMGELRQMHYEMQEILEFNYNHFFNDFKKIITDELVDNFCGVLDKVNHGRIPGNHSKYHVRYDLSPEKVQEVKTRLLL